MITTADAAAIAVVRRNTEQVQGRGDWQLFDALFADDFVDHTPQPGTTADKPGVLALYQAMGTGFPDFTPEIEWQIAKDGLVTTYKIYRGTRPGRCSGSRPPAGPSSSRPST
jgi:SnoaL-like polyketide cyclase